MSEIVSKWEFDEHIPSDPGKGCDTIRQLLEQLEQHEWSDKDVFGIHMAMEEAVMNAIKHGNECDPCKCVHLRMELSENEFYARITDEGCGFDPDEVPDPTADENLEKFSGRGLMLIRNFVDRVVYSDKGNSVELFKSRSE